MQLFEHFTHAWDEQKFLWRISAAAGQPVNNPYHLVVNANRVGEFKQGVAWRFNPHDKTMGGAVWIFEQKMRKEARNILGV